MGDVLEGGAAYGDELMIWLLRSDKQRTVGMVCIWDSLLIGLKIYLVVRDFLLTCFTSPRHGRNDDH
jgi:hypothetical protein